MADLTVAEIERRFIVDAEAGRLYFKTKPQSEFKNTQACGMWNARNAGREAGYIRPDGYRRISDISAHRIIWTAHYGAPPKGEIDHVNGDRADNRISNLRDVSASENRRNQRRRATNSSGHTGVFRDRKLGKWQAQIRVNGRSIYLGNYNSLDEAVAARKAADREYGFHENHGRTHD